MLTRLTTSAGLRKRIDAPDAIRRQARWYALNIQAAALILSLFLLLALVEALRGAVAGIADRQPTVVFLDDVQWADEATLELLPALAVSVEGRPLLFLAVYRSDEVTRTHPLRRMRADLRRGARLDPLLRGGDGQTAARSARAASSIPAP